MICSHYFQPWTQLKANEIEIFLELYENTWLMMSCWAKFPAKLISRLNPTLVWTLSSDIQNFLSSSLFSVYKEWFWVSICSPPAIIDIWRFHFSITSTQLIIWFVANYRQREEREDAITICFRVDHTVFYALLLLILGCVLYRGSMSINRDKH